MVKTSYEFGGDTIQHITIILLIPSFHCWVHTFPSSSLHPSDWLFSRLLFGPGTVSWEGHCHYLEKVAPEQSRGQVCGARIWRKVRSLHRSVQSWGSDVSSYLEVELGRGVKQVGLGDATKANDPTISVLNSTNIYFLLMQYVNCRSVRMFCSIPSSLRFQALGSSVLMIPLSLRQEKEIVAYCILAYNVFAQKWDTTLMLICHRPEKIIWSYQILRDQEN